MKLYWNCRRNVQESVPSLIWVNNLSRLSLVGSRPESRKSGRVSKISTIIPSISCINCSSGNQSVELDTRDRICVQSYSGSSLQVRSRGMRLRTYGHRVIALPPLVPLHCQDQDRSNLSCRQDILVGHSQALQLGSVLES